MASSLSAQAKKTTLNDRELYCSDPDCVYCKSILERPVRVPTVISGLRAAKRARDRQRQVQGLLLQEKESLSIQDDGNVLPHHQTPPLAAHA